jgi:hypothetical protein
VDVLSVLQKMKSLFFHLSLCTLLATSAQAQLVEFASDGVKAEWNKSVNDRSKLLKERVLGDGLSSTGKITVTDIYTLTHDETIGNLGDKIALVVQEDLLGSRLFSIHIMNLRTGNTRQLYRTGESTEAEQAGTGQPATRPESDAEGGEEPQPEAEGRSR